MIFLKIIFLKIICFGDLFDIFSKKTWIQRKIYFSYQMFRWYISRNGIQIEIISEVKSSLQTIQQKKWNFFWLSLSLWHSANWSPVSNTKVCIPLLLSYNQNFFNFLSVRERRASVGASANANVLTSVDPTALLNTVVGLINQLVGILLCLVNTLQLALTSGAGNLPLVGNLVSGLISTLQGVLTKVTDALKALLASVPGVTAPTADCSLLSSLNVPQLVGGIITTLSLVVSGLVNQLIGLVGSASALTGPLTTLVPTLSDLSAAVKALLSVAVSV